MKQIARNLLLASCLFFAISYDCCISGVNYDKRHKLYPEIESYTCTMNTVYGLRWERFGTATFLIGTILLFSAFIIRRRKQESKVGSILSLVKE